MFLFYYFFSEYAILSLSAPFDQSAASISHLSRLPQFSSPPCPLLSDMLKYPKRPAGKEKNLVAMIMNRPATKANGIKILAAHYGISPEEIAVFGDDYNDIDMLQSCGIGIAVDMPCRK